MINLFVDVLFIPHHLNDVSDFQLITLFCYFLCFYCESAVLLDSLMPSLYLLYFDNCINLTIRWYIIEELLTEMTKWK